MNETLTPIPLITVRRISQVTGLPVSEVRRILDEHPDIRPAAVADFRPVYDRDALRRFCEIIASLEVAQ